MTSTEKIDKLQDLLAKRKAGATLQSYDESRELWIDVSDDILASCLRHFLDTEEFWDLRVKPPSVVVIPAGVFWVRCLDKEMASLVVTVNTRARRVHLTASCGIPFEKLTEDGWQWSRDRVTWQPFVTAEVSS